MIVSLIMTGIILLTVYGFRRERGVIYLVGLIVCRMLYSSSIILERHSDVFMTKLIFRNIQNTTQNVMVPFLILFVYHLVGRDKLLKTQWKILLFAVFVSWSLLMWLDPNLHIIYLTIELYNGHLVTTKTLYSRAFSLICYSAVVICLYYLFQYVRNIRSDYRKPGMWVLLLATLPFVLEIIKFVKPEWSSWLLPLTVYCGSTGTIMLVIILRIKFFSTVPIARNIVLDTLQESIVIVNGSGKVIDN
ncbi:histidine kinase N-terminal 7TM domain-containing protein, partial [Bacillus velezensis]|uniref:histidine kinase N-terminal 7TM domain-containing protein n=1 Tax=Bacillus velezensis TaxID=492670 RepID=UPI00339AB4A8